MRTIIPLLLLASMTIAAHGDEPDPSVQNRAADSRQLAVLLGHRSEVVPVAYSPDGSILASGSWDGEVILWDTAKQKAITTLRGHEGRVGQLVFTSDGKRLAVAGGKEVRLWDVAARKATRLPHAQWHTYSLTFSPNNQLLAYVDGPTVVVHNLSQGEEPGRRFPHERHINTLTFSPDGNKLAVADETLCVTLWNLRTGKRIFRLDGSDEFIRGLRFSDDGRHLTAVAVNGVLWWDIALRKRVASRPLTSRLCGEVAFSDDGALAASSDFVGNVHLVDLDRGRVESVIDSDIVPVWDVIFSPDGKLLAWATRQHEIWLWDLKARRVRAKLPGHTNRITGLTFSPDSRVLASGSWDGTVRLWKTGD